MSKYALTFDDGPSAWTGEILDLLAAAEAHATFFVLGTRIEGHESLLRRMRDEGHEIGNHTWSHTPLVGLDDDTVREEFEKTQGAIVEAVGEAPIIWRAPYLRATPESLRIATSLGLRHVGFTFDPADFRSRSPEIIERVLNNLFADSIIDMHDGCPPNEEASRAHVVAAVAEILRRVDGHDCVTVSDLQGVIA